MNFVVGKKYKHVNFPGEFTYLGRSGLPATWGLFSDKNGAEVEMLLSNMTDGDALKPFWFVWKEHGGAPTFRHESKRAAEQEAERLARDVGGKFFVGCCVAAVEVGELKWERTCNDVEIPF